MPENKVITEKEQLVAKESLNRNLLEIIGTGINFPLRFNTEKKVGSIEISNAGERIQDSIHLILATRIGERAFNPEFGSRLHELVFEPSDEILKRLLVYYTAQALNRWEKRIDIQEVIILEYPDPSTVGIQIEYTIRNSHIRGSYVYPFVREGMATGDLYTGAEASRMLAKGQVVE